MKTERESRYLSGDRVPGPVRLLNVEEDDARVLVLVRVIAPHVPALLSADSIYNIAFAIFFFFFFSLSVLFCCCCCFC
jgi:hypothetical protein